MLGTVGFISGAAAFALYGYSSFRLADQVKFKRTNYLIAYILTSAACIVWGLSIQLSDNLLNWVIAGDVLLLVATAYLLSTLIEHKITLPYYLGASALISGLLYFRLTSTALAPVVRNSVLIFNTPRLFGTLLSIILLAIWVRANMNFYTKVVNRQFPNILRPLYYSMNLFGFVSVTAFLLSRKDVTIIIAFTILVMSFVMLAVLNFYVKGAGSNQLAGKPHAA